MKRIVFGITNLNLGGAERVLVDLANRLSKENFDVTIQTIYSNGVLEKSLNSNVKVGSIETKSYEDLSKLEKIKVSLKMLFFKKAIYKKYIKDKYDIEIAFLEGAITNLFSVNGNAKKIAWVHTDLSMAIQSNIKGKLKRKMNSKIYNKYEKIIFVSKDSLEKFNEVYKIGAKKQVIYNYIDSDNVVQKSNEEIDIIDANEFNFLEVARLVESKAIDRIIDVHSKLISEGYNHKFFIIGDGVLRENLENKIKDKQVEDTFILLGEKENPYPYIKKCDCVCLLSYYEGYGMILEEAKILQKYLLTTDTAAREAVQGYSKKQVVENNETAIYNAMKEIISKSQEIKSNKEEILYDNEYIINEIKQLM